MGWRQANVLNLGATLNRRMTRITSRHVLCQWSILTSQSRAFVILRSRSESAVSHRSKTTDGPAHYFRKRNLYKEAAPARRFGNIVLYHVHSMKHEETRCNSVVLHSFRVQSE